MKVIPVPFWLLGVLCWFVSFKYSHIYIVQPQLDLYFIDVIGATTATILVYLASKAVSHIPLLGQSFSWIGKYSLFILCFHLIDLDCGISGRLNLTSSSTGYLLNLILLPIIGTVIFTEALKVYQSKGFRKKRND